MYVNTLNTLMQFNAYQYYNLEVTFFEIEAQGTFYRDKNAKYTHL